MGALYHHRVQYGLSAVQGMAENFALGQDAIFFVIHSRRESGADIQEMVNAKPRTAMFTTVYTEEAQTCRPAGQLEDRAAI